MNDTDTVEQPTTEQAHDVELCLCGYDPIDEAKAGPACMCPCPKCKANRDRVIQLWDLSKMIDRLDSLGIDVDQLVTVLWAEMESQIEERIEKIARHAVEKALRNIRLVSVVQYSSIDR